MDAIRKYVGLYAHFTPIGGTLYSLVDRFEDMNEVQQPRKSHAWENEPIQHRYLTFPRFVIGGFLYMVARSVKTAGPPRDRQ